MKFAIYIDSNELARRIAGLLEVQDMHASFFDSAEALMRASHYGAFDAIVVDTRGAGACDDADLATWMRCRVGRAAPVILLCADHAPDKIVRMLDEGADDVVARPFSVEEVVARVRAALRRAARQGDHGERIGVAGFTLDRRCGWLLDRGRMVDLTPREFDMAWFLFSNPGAFASRESISLAVWGQDKDITERTIEQHAYMLRKKLGLCEERGVRLRAAYGRGYRIDVRDPVAATSAQCATPLPVGLHSPALAIAAMLESSWPDQGLALS